MQVKYRTELGWDNKELTIIKVSAQNDDGYFTLLGFNKKAEIEAGQPTFGVSDVVEFEVFPDAE